MSGARGTHARASRSEVGELRRVRRASPGPAAVFPGTSGALLGSGISAMHGDHPQSLHFTTTRET